MVISIDPITSIFTSYSVTCTQINLSGVDSIAPPLIFIFIVMTIITLVIYATIFNLVRVSTLKFSVYYDCT